MNSDVFTDPRGDDNISDVDDDENVKATERRRIMFRLGSSFFLFGLINNVLYVIVLSAALDLVPADIPKGIVAFFNIAPAFAAKVGWPIISKGKIRYSKRLSACCALSVSGMLLIAAFNAVWMRLLGIALASFASGLGELTFLQLSTVYHPPSIAGLGLGYFSSGTGAAGLVGAFLWWNLRNLGVRVGVSISAIFPFIIPLVYKLWIPQPAIFDAIEIPSSYEPDSNSTTGAYAQLPASEDTTRDEERTSTPFHQHQIHSPIALNGEDKRRLVKPLILKYMTPLFCVYLFEYTINQGIAPTLIFPVPSTDKYPLLGFIRSVRDFYPFWQLVYQAAVFLSRSSISLGLPPLPARLLYLPALIQAVILISLALEAGLGIIPDTSEGLAVGVCFLLISIEGFCGGSAYVNVFYHINQEPMNAKVDLERAKQEKEFKIGSIGLADSLGILTASLLAVPAEVSLCRAQVSRGKVLCKNL